MCMMCYYCDCGTVARYLSVYLLITQYTDRTTVSLSTVNINIGNIHLIRLLGGQRLQQEIIEGDQSNFISKGC